MTSDYVTKKDVDNFEVRFKSNLESWIEDRLTLMEHGISNRLSNRVEGIIWRLVLVVIGFSVIVNCAFFVAYKLGEL